MFKFNRVLNATTGEWYYIDRARLATDEYDWSPNGGNTYIISLQPLSDEDASPIAGLTLSTNNNFDYAMITKGLDKAASTHKTYSEELGTDVVREDLRDCIIHGNTLIVTQDVSGAALEEILKEPAGSVGEVAGIVKTLRAVMDAEGRKPYEIAEAVEKVCLAAGIPLPKDFVKRD